MMNAPRKDVELKTQHQQLYEEALRNCRIIADDPNTQKKFLEKFDRLLAGMKAYSHHIQTFEDQRWLKDALIKWHSAFSSVLGIPRDVLGQVEVQPPRPESRKPLSKGELTKYIETTAFFKSHSRMVMKIDKLGEDRRNTIIRRFQQNPDKIYEIISEEIVNTEEERHTDWYNATVSTASEILDGKINFAYQMGSDTYDHLEETWLKDVKLMKAYFIWKRKGSNWGGEQENYDEACWDIRRRLLDPQFKAPLDYFAEAKAYLQDRYLRNDEIDEGKENTTRLIQTKAKRICQTTGDCNEEVNRQRAERYIRMYYENIVPAVENKKVESIDKVLEAFRFSKEFGRRYLIINCFEAAIAMYFLDPEVIKARPGRVEDIL